MDDDFIEAINTTADTSFDVSAPTKSDASAHTNCTGDRITCPVVLNLLANPRFFTRPSGSKARGFIDGERRPGGVTPTTCPPYLGPPSGRAGNADEKRGAWQLQEEYLAGRLGKNEEENGRLWNTVKWIDKHYRIVTMPAEALPPLNIYVGDKISQSTDGTGAPTGPDDEAPDEVENEGVEFESINVGEADGQSSMCVMDENETTHRLEIKAGDYAVLRLADALEEIDKSAKIDVNDLMREAPPLLPQTDFPSSDQRAESGKIIRMLKVRMHTLWHPVIRSIADHVTMTSLGKTQGAGDKVAAAVGRQRVIEGLRLAESIRKGLGRQDRPFSMWLNQMNQIRARQTIVNRPGFSVDDTIKGTLVVLADKTAPVISMPMIGDYEPVMVRQDNDGDTARGSLLAVLTSTSLPKPVRAPEGHYLNMAAGPVIKKLLPTNDNCRVEAAAAKAA